MSQRPRRKRRYGTAAVLIIAGGLLLVSIEIGERLGDRVLRQSTETRVPVIAAPVTPAPTGRIGWRTQLEARTDRRRRDGSGVSRPARHADSAADREADRGAAEAFTDASAPGHRARRRTVHGTTVDVAFELHLAAVGVAAHAALAGPVVLARGPRRLTMGRIRRNPCALGAVQLREELFFRR